MADGMALELQVSSNAEQAMRGLRELTAALEALSSAAGKTSRIGNVASQLDEIRESGQQTAESTRDIAEGVEESGIAARRANGGLRALTTSLRNIVGERHGIRTVASSIGSVAGVMRRISFAPLQGMGAIVSQGAVAFSRFGAVIRTIGKEALPVIRSIGSAGKTGLMAVWNGWAGTISASAKGAYSAIRQLSSGFSRLRSAIGNGIGRVASSAFNALKSKITESFSGVTKLFNAIKRIAFYRLIRSAIKAVTDAVKEGTENLYWWSKAMNGSFAQSMDAGASASLKFKNSIAAMLAPAIEAVMPLLIRLANLAIQAANAINQFISMLFGRSSWTRAKDVSAAAYELKNAGGSAKKADDEFKHLLADWDELNIIASETSKSGSGGGGAADSLNPADMFEQVPLEKNQWTDLAAQLKAAIAAGDWKGAGAIVADKLNEAIDKLNPMELAHKINAYVRRGLLFLNGLLANLNFENLGKKIGTFLSGIFGKDNLETWATLGDDMRLWFMGKLQVLKGIVETPGLWEDIGSSVGEMLKKVFAFTPKEVEDAGDAIGGLITGAFTAALTALDKIPAEIGTSFGKLIIRLFGKVGMDGTRIGGTIDFKVIGAALKEAVQKAFAILQKFLDEKPGASIGSTFAELVNSFFKIDAASVGTTVGKAITDATDAGLALVEFTDTANIGTKFGEFIKSLFGSVDDSGDYKQGSIDFGKIGTLVQEGVTKALQGVEAFLKTPGLAEGIGESFSTLVSSFFEIDSEYVGSVLAMAVNKGVLAANRFITKTPFALIGWKIRGFLAKTIGDISWTSIGTLLKNGLVSAASMLNEINAVDENGESIWTKAGNAIVELFKGFKLDDSQEAEIASAIGGAVNGPFTTALTALDGGALDKLGEDLGGIISKVFGTVDENGTYKQGTVSFETIGTTLQKGVETAFQEFDDFLNTPGLAEEIGTSFAKLLESFFALDTKSVGQTIGNAVNKAVLMAYTFINKTPFAMIGIKIRRLLMGVFATDNGGVNWTKLGETAKQAVLGVVRTINTIIAPDGEGNTVFTEAGSNIAKAVNALFALDDAENGEAAQALGGTIAGIASGAKQFFSETDFHAIGVQVGEFLRNVLGKNGTVGWKTIGEALKEGFLAAFDFLGGLFSGKTPQKVPLQINMNPHYGEVEKYLGEAAKAAGPLESLGAGLAEFVNSAFDLTPEQRQKLVDTLNNAVKDAIGGVKRFFTDTKWEKIGKDIAYWIEHIDWPGIAQSLWQGIGKVFEAAGTVLDYVLMGLNNAVAKWWNNSWFGEHLGQANLFGDVKAFNQWLSTGSVEGLFMNSEGRWVSEREYIETVADAIELATKKGIEFKDVMNGVASGDIAAGSDGENETAEEINRISKALEEAVQHGKDYNSVVQEMQGMIPLDVSDSDQTETLEYEIESADGEPIQIETTIQPIPEVDMGAMQGFFDNLYDELANYDMGGTWSMAPNEFWQNVIKPIVQNASAAAGLTEEATDEVTRGFFEKWVESLYDPDWAGTTEDLIGILQQSIESAVPDTLKAPETTGYNDSITGAKDTTVQAARESIYALRTWYNVAQSVFGGTATSGLRIPTVGPVHLAANGGIMTTGQMFIAREAGPELVGTMGGHTAVANNEQIVAGISNGVASANAEQNALLRRQNELLTQLLNKKITAEAVPSAAWGRQQAQSAEMYARQTGRG